MWKTCLRTTARRGSSRIFRSMRRVLKEATSSWTTACQPWQATSAALLIRRVMWRSMTRDQRRINGKQGWLGNGDIFIAFCIEEGGAARRTGGQRLFISWRVAMGARAQSFGPLSTTGLRGSELQISERACAVLRLEGRNQDPFNMGEGFGRVAHGGWLHAGEGQGPRAGSLVRQV